MDESLCTYCQKPAVRKPHTWKFKRGDKSVEVQSDYWECTSNCMGPDGVMPFSWLGPLLMKECDDKIAIAWGEPLPPRRPL
jgi:hypothetical protein